MKIRENVPISELTTMRLGGPARYVIEVESPADVKAAYAFAEEKNLPTWIMGEGANTIGKDKGFNGVIIINKIKGIEILHQTKEEITIKGMGGEIWDDFVAFSVGETPVSANTKAPASTNKTPANTNAKANKEQYTGIEALSKIPGTLGAAPVQNIGAYGQEISQVIDSVEAYDTKTHTIKTISKSAMQMSYRQTIFNSGKDAGRYFIISVTITLKKGQLKPPFYNSLQHYIDEHKETDLSPQNIRKMVSDIRSQKLPDPQEIPSAGSFFKNVTLKTKQAIADAESKNYPTYKKPDGSTIINSGWLIESAGLKGQEFYGMQVSDKAALILINKSAKSYADLAKARAQIQQIIQEKFGYTLEQEPVEIPA